MRSVLVWITMCLYVSVYMCVHECVHVYVSEQFTYRRVSSVPRCPSFPDSPVELLAQLAPPLTMTSHLRWLLP